MSVVAVAVKEGTIEIASDSISVRGLTQTKANNKFSKLVYINDMYIGFVGEAEEGSLFTLFANTRKPEQTTEAGIVAYLSEFADWKNNKIGKASIENDYIIIIAGKVFQVEGFFVQEIVSYSAIGAGSDYALAALYLGETPVVAVETACELSVFCEKPIKHFKVIVKTGEKEL